MASQDPYLADAFFNAEKKRRKYDPSTGYYIDPVSGKSGPDVEPFERPKFLARLFSPQANELIGYNKQWIDKPREATLNRNIEKDYAADVFKNSSDQNQKELVSAGQAWATGGAKPRSDENIESAKMARALTGANFAEANAQDQNNAALANAAENQNRLLQAKTAQLLGTPKFAAESDLARNKYNTQHYNSEGTLIAPRAQNELLKMDDERQTLETIAPLMRDRQQRLYGQVYPYQDALEAVRAREVGPVAVGNEYQSARNTREKLKGEADLTPYTNRALIAEGAVKADLAEKNREMTPTLIGTQQNKNYAGLEESRLFGMNPIQAHEKGVVASVNANGGVDYDRSLLPLPGSVEALYNDQELKDNGVNTGQSRFHINGTDIEPPPALTTSPISKGNRPGGGLMAPIPSRGASMGGMRSDSVAAELPTPTAQGPQPVVQATLGAGEPSNAPAGWSVNDIMKSQINRQVRPLNPQERQVTEGMHNEFRTMVKSLGETSIGSKVASDLLAEALADEVGVTQDFIDKNIVRGSMTKKLTQAMRENPVVKAKVDNLPPQQLARVYQKVKEGLIERGLMKNDQPELIAPVGKPRNTNSPFLTERYGL